MQGIAYYNGTKVGILKVLAPTEYTVECLVVELSSNKQYWVKYNDLVLVVWSIAA